MIITQTSTRLSIFGGNTDFREYFIKHGGKVLTASIDKYIYCIVKKKFDDLIIVNYSEKETVTKVDDLKHNIVREALKLVGITKGIEISFLADIPSQGTGLGSSSAVTVGVLNALHTYVGENVSANQLAEEAVHIEIDILKNPIGIQDQCAVAFGGLRMFEFKAISGEVITEKVKISESMQEDFNNSLMLFYTGVTRNTNEVLSRFDVASNIEALNEKKLLVEKGVTALTSGNLGDFGRLLDKSWKTKRV
ncbi:MAG: GHMP kinase, partial [Nanoarchaeota archaeon]